ncbi:MAG: oxidoreductase [Gammaproteobacteria bacterium]|nr:oxidoreductase [Gammaproteobacteria bacterium]MCB1872294.1 oxidoreductase [Gammaproteobacteria bacterium]MCB1879393.1 oxidoreductase [Gammaproteobacteria bacterium]MCB1904782.1 oxidoreductase [Gammaproteobacteria bacterium]
MTDEFFIQPKAYDISKHYRARVVSSERITSEKAEAEVREIVLDIPAHSFVYVEGQSIGVLAPPPYEFGNDHHMRLYSIASTRKGEKGNRTEIAICVRRCFYIDEISGERYPGKCSNYLCDAKAGEEIRITGPYGRHFIMPRDTSANMLMVGTGTGIAPFRAFIKHVYEEEEEWKGKIRLFYGAKSGLDMLYMNDIKNDFSHYYDEATFKAFEALSSRPAFEDPGALENKLEENAAEVWELMQDPKTHVYVAGIRAQSKELDTALAHIAGSEQEWMRLKREIYLDGRWAEHLYD